MPSDYAFLRRKRDKTLKQIYGLINKLSVANEEYMNARIEHLKMLQRIKK